MRPHAFIAVFALIAPLAQAEAQAPATVDDKAIPNYHRLHPGLATAGQPSEEGLAKLKELGFKTVVNLRTPGEKAPAGEQAMVEGQGLRYVSVPVSPTTLGAAEVAAVRAVLDDEAAAPVLLHCATANRAAALWGLVEVDKGRPAEEVEAEAVKAGLSSPVLIETFRRLAREKEPAARP